mgnify:CR=1 FL=1
MEEAAMAMEKLSVRGGEGFIVCERERRQGRLDGGGNGGLGVRR